MPFRLLPNVAWLTVNPDTGVAGEWPALTTIEYLVDQLSAGVHTGQIWVSSPVATNSPVAIDISIELTPERGVPRLSPDDLDIRVPVGTTNAVGSVELRNDGTGTVHYALRLNIWPEDPD